MTQPIGTQELQTALPPHALTSVSTRSRSSSPREPSEATYRAQTFFRAGIHVDVNVPRQVQSNVDLALEAPPATLATINHLATKLQRESLELTAAQAGETEWTVLLHEILKELKSTDVIVARNRDWRPDLKPEVHQPSMSIPQKRLRDNLGDKVSEYPRITAGPKAPLPSAQSSDSSLLDKPQTTEPTSAGQLATAPFSLKDPRPDISAGLSDQALALALRSVHGDSAKFYLHDLQETGSLISDPGEAPLGLRFPFLLVETKSGATGGNLYQAQNQAAVGGASAINILKGIFPLRCLSFLLPRKGPICELWAHFWDVNEHSYCMANVGVWRTTHMDGAFDFVSKISRVLNWGTGRFKDAIVERLALL
ncbi:uncharacterized protein BO80DRAFT_491275 [Aspergillus ibericus CBS 121593]|uniref:DUF7924 domain-containing protein n=1 Tax=Aspergillus ibericus CBS 121593 TaxID=1448316 RepID=A0A395H7V3_9EURO|nr:hypothetical protein BO80DRAFT_491275 [Aspergillus ibericus CBS 121593]RAL04021.1 hypothetical protein BO80DRAFT_491275 [Aspergillus ibericus CBS 121593]